MVHSVFQVLCEHKEQTVQRQSIQWVMPVLNPHEKGGETRTKQMSCVYT